MPGERSDCIPSLSPCLTGYKTLETEQGAPLLYKYSVFYAVRSMNSSSRFSQVLLAPNFSDKVVVELQCEHPPCRRRIYWTLSGCLQVIEPADKYNSSSWNPSCISINLWSKVRRQVLCNCIKVELQMYNPLFTVSHQLNWKTFTGKASHYSPRRYVTCYSSTFQGFISVSGACKTIIVLFRQLKYRFAL